MNDHAYQLRLFSYMCTVEYKYVKDLHFGANMLLLSALLHG